VFQRAVRDYDISPRIRDFARSAVTPNARRLGISTSRRIDLDPGSLPTNELSKQVSSTTAIVQHPVCRPNVPPEFKQIGCRAEFAYALMLLKVFRVIVILSR
jgi:hypothetical protein